MDGKEPMDENEVDSSQMGWEPDELWPWTAIMAMDCDQAKQLTAPGQKGAHE